MIQRTTFLTLLIVIAGLALIAGTGGFSSATADRAFDVEIVEDQRAFVGFEQNTTNITNETTDLEVTVRNQFLYGTSLERVQVTVNDTTKHLASDSIEPGERASETFNSVTCNDQIRVIAMGTGTKVAFNRTVDCP